MATWILEARSPGAGGAWTTVSGKSEFSFKKEVNVIWTAQATVQNPSSAIQTVLKRENEFRIRESGSAKEWFRGRIRDVTRDDLKKEWKVYIHDIAILLKNRVWTSRRDFPSVPANIVLDEILNSNEGEPKNGQVLRFDMETLTTDATPLMEDLSGNSNHGTIGGTVATIDGKWGKARRGNTINAAHSTTLDVGGTTSRYTIACWFRVSAPPSIKLGFLSKFTNGNTTYPFRCSITTTGTLDFAINDGTVIPATFSTTNISDDKWYHVACVRNVDLDRLEVWVNAKLENTTTDTTTVSTANTGAVRVFEDQTPTTDTFFDCDVDELYIYNRALTSDEISALAGRRTLTGGVGTVDTFTAVAFRADESNRLAIADSLARGVAAEWFVDRDANDKDRLNLVSRIGNAASQDTFRFGGTARPIDRKIESHTLFNDITTIGNSGTAKTKSRNFHATTKRTTLDADLSASATTATVVSTTGFPTAGILFIGAERARYTGTTATTFTGLTRAYTADGFASLAAYEHKKDIEVFMHADEVASPIVYRTPENAETGSGIKDDGWSQTAYVDQFYRDQGALDRLAQRLLAKFRVQRESVVIDVTEPTITADIGDNVTVQNQNGTAYENSPYRIFAYSLSWPKHIWKLELANYRDAIHRRIVESDEKANQSTLFVPEAGTKGVAKYSQTNITLPTNTETEIVSTTAAGIKKGQKVLIRAWASVIVGAGTTRVQLRIRRGLGTGGASDPQIDAVAVDMPAPRDDVIALAATVTAFADDPSYTATLLQIDATANGQSLSEGIEIVPIG